MAELKQFDTHLGPLSYFQYPCGHKFIQTQDCPVCSDERQIKHILDQGVAYGVQIEKRERVLRECWDLIKAMYKFREEEGIMTEGLVINNLQTKIDEVLR